MPDKRYQQQVVREEVKTIRSQHRGLELPVTGQCVELEEPMNASSGHRRDGNPTSFWIRNIHIISPRKKQMDGKCNDHLGCSITW